MTWDPHKRKPLDNKEPPVDRGFIHDERSYYDRKPSVLTNSQREYLVQGDESQVNRSAKQERDLRARIKQRLRESTWDYSIVLDELPLSDLCEALKPAVDISPHPQVGELYTVVDKNEEEQPRREYFPESKHDGNNLLVSNLMEDMIAVLFLSGMHLEDPNLDPAESAHSPEVTRHLGGMGDLGWFMEGTVREGITKAIRRLGVVPENVNVDIEIEFREEFPDISDMDLSDIHEDTLIELYLADEISYEDIMDALEEDNS